MPLTGGNDPSGIEGFPYYRELVDRYAQKTGRDVSQIDYYRAFSSYRLAVIAEGVYARYLNGAMADEMLDLDSMKNSVNLRVEYSLDMLKHLE